MLKKIVFILFFMVGSIWGCAKETNCRYTFWQEPFISPKIIKDLATWLSDRGDQVVAINLLDSQHSNRYSCGIKKKDIANQYPFVYFNPEEGASFGYQYKGKTSSGIYVLEISDSVGGSGVFKDLMFVEIKRDKGLNFNEKESKITNGRERLIIRKLGEITLGDRWAGKIKVEGERIIIGKDKGWFAQVNKDYGKKTKTRAIKIEIVK